MAKNMSDSNTPTHEQITRRAYEIFVERGQPEGQDLEHWLEAEKQLRATGQSKNADAGERQIQRQQHAQHRTHAADPRHATRSDLQWPFGGERQDGSSAARSQEIVMPDKRTIKRARRDAREGKSASTQAGEFVRAEIDKVRQGKHGVRNTKQAIAIGLS